MTPTPSILPQAGILTTLITTKLMDVKSVFNKIDPPTVAKILEPQIKASTVRALDAVLGGSFPMVWSALPPPLKQEAAEAASKDSVVLIRLMMEALRENILSVLDLRHLAVKHAENNKDLVVKVGHFFIHNLVFFSSSLNLCFVRAKRRFGIHI